MGRKNEKEVIICRKREKWNFVLILFLVFILSIGVFVLYVLKSIDDMVIYSMLALFSGCLFGIAGGILFSEDTNWKIIEEIEERVRIREVNGK